jgi:uncharacterized protein
VHRAQADLQIRELLQPTAFPHSVRSIELRETHVSWVVLTGSYAYKVKKPVKLDFLDASTLQQRRHFCEEELRLNRRLAPELYLDVVSIGREAGHAVVGSGEPAIEYAVRMRQFPESDELPALLARGEIDAAQLSELGGQLARFHASAAVAPPSRAPERTLQMCDLVRANLTQLSEQMASLRLASGAHLSRLADWTQATMRLLQPMFQLREQCGFVREGHGDLHAANIVAWRARLVPFDCIEFDPRLRWIDEMDDVAFLVMDLAKRERSDLAFALLTRYLETGGDYDGVRLLPFYAVYRALVRAKVEVLRGAQLQAVDDDLEQRVRRDLAAAASWMEPQHPTMVLMHGVSGSGKSWLSERLVPELRAVRIRSDVERKRLARIAAAQSARAGIHEGIYSPELTRRTYGRLAECAQSCLRAGLSVIVDASFLRHADRVMFRRLAADMRVPCVIVACRAEPATLTARLSERARARNDASDATLSILDAQLRSNHALEPSEERCAILVDTTGTDAVRRVASEISLKRSPLPSR